jgi:hypothetical protein
VRVQLKRSLCIEAALVALFISLSAPLAGAQNEGGRGSARPAAANDRPLLPTSAALSSRAARMAAAAITSASPTVSAAATARRLIVNRCTSGGVDRSPSASTR